MTFIKSLSKLSLLTLLATAVAFSPGVSFAGPVFLTGHDPDFHAQLTVGAQNLLNTGLSFVTGGTYNGGVEKFLWIESRIAPPGGHLIGENGLTSIGLVLGTHYDRANAAELAAVNFSNYSAIAVASSFGGLLTQAELDALIARAGDIATFINGGGGLFASSECFPTGPACLADLLTGASPLYGYLPVTVSSIAPAPPFTVTAFGASLGLTNSDLNDPTHNSFGDIGGLTPVDLDQNLQSKSTTLAGDVTVGVCGDGVLDLGEQCDDGNTENGDGCSAQCEIEVVENEAPDCSAAEASPGMLWPPNHKMVNVEIVGVTDPDSDPIAMSVTGVTQDEPVKGIGSGKKSPDAVVLLADGSVNVRAERTGAAPHNGRVYSISFTATDPAGLSCSRAVAVCVPHDQRDPHECADDGQLYDSTLP